MPPAAVRTPVSVRSTALRRTAAASGVAVLTLVAGCTSDGGDSEKATSEPVPSAPTATPLAKYDTSTVELNRSDFCSVITSDAVERTLGSKPGKSSSYSPGDRIPVSSGGQDVASEFGCTYQRGKEQAAVWVFSPRVPQERARKLADTAGKRPGCAVVEKAPTFGKPTVARVCRDEKGKTVTASFRGLFIDAWMVCEVTSGKLKEPQQKLVRRTGEWCVDVATAASEEN